MRREDWDRRYAERELLWSAHPNRFLVAEADGLAPGRALDLACGEGRNAIWLAELGWQVTAVDFSEVAIAKARERTTRDGVVVDFVCTDLLDFVPEPEAYDLVLVLYLQLPARERGLVLQLPARERGLVLCRAASALAPAGTFLLVGHDLANLTEGVGGPSDPGVLYTLDEIVSELPGLEIEKAERVLRDVENEDRPAIDALVTARRG